MLREALAELERRVRAEAPTLLTEVQAVASLAMPAPLSRSLQGNTVSLGGAEGAGAPSAERVAEAAFPVAGRDRYMDLGLLGQGGMGEVRRVRDAELNRVVALKQVRADAVGPAMLARLVEEVQTTAQLQHPGIVPVYDAGRTGDGGVYFTMKEVQGRELSDVIRSVHAVSGERWETTGDGWSLRRLVGALHQASQAVAYAHERGVLHRDLKPANVMVGAYGEVLVMDWGLSKVRGRTDTAAEPVVVERTRAATRVGRVMGTPAYMSPEQARGDVTGTDARTDVYALGAMLYEVLTGRSPYEGEAAREVLAQVLTGPPRSVRGARGRVAQGEAAATLDWEGDGPGAPDAEPREERPASGRAEPSLPVPEELAAACERAMARDPGDRYATATAFSEALESWLDGSRRREQALGVVARAAEKGPEAAALRARAAALRVEAAAELEGVAGWQPEEDKAGAWAKEDEASALEGQAALAELEQESLLRASLTHAADLPEAHAALAERYRAEHAAQEAARQGATRSEAWLRHHLGALPEAHPVRRAGVAYLKGDGALTLVTEPPGAEVVLYRYELRNRRRVEVFERSLGRTPLREVMLPVGSWLCLLRHPDGAVAGERPVRYPVFVSRGEHWDGVKPGGSEPHPVRLPRPGEVGSEEDYVPAGWFWSGGDPAALNGLPRRRLWSDGLVFRRFPVTNRAYLEFLDALVAAGREDEALRHAPRERPGTADDLGALIYGYDGRRFTLRPDADGDVWDPEWPVVQVDWPGARAFAAWEAGRTGRAWGLPGELSWEKAARGVDGRFFPWGDQVDPSWACYRDSHQGRPLPSVVDSFPKDVSVYGVRGLGGNTRDWCADLWRAEGPAPVGAQVGPPDLAAEEVAAVRAVRGGGWYYDPACARVASRSRIAASDRSSYLGFRLSRSAP